MAVSVMSVSLRKTISASVGWAASLLDHLGPLAFSRRRNFDIGWGGDLDEVLKRGDVVRERCTAASSSEPVKIEWDGPWKEVKASGGKFAFLNFFKRWTYGDDPEKEKFDTLLVRDASYLSPYADLLPEGCKVWFIFPVLILSRRLLHAAISHLTCSGFHRSLAAGMSSVLTA